MELITLLFVTFSLYHLQTNSMNLENLGNTECGGSDFTMNNIRRFGITNNLGLIQPQIPPIVQTSQDADNVEQLNQVSSKRKRKRSKREKEDDVKRCNCLKSKCLKLYCECFANGVYCLDSCACNDCYNNIDYEDTVLDVRQQIESRNPHAFAPKVVNSPTNTITDETNRPSFASARHIRGCNCKKSRCLKNYCECYQAKVGCSDSCRCENCINSFGTKAEQRVYMRGKMLDNSSNKGKVEPVNTEDNITMSQFFSTWNELWDITNPNPSSTNPSSSNQQWTSPNTIDHSTTLQGDQLLQRNTLLQVQPSAANSLHLHSSSFNHGPIIHSNDIASSFHVSYYNNMMGNEIYIQTAKDSTQNQEPVSDPTGYIKTPQKF